MKQRVNRDPVLHRTHIGDMRFSGIEHPLAEGIKQDIGCQTGSKHHGAPLEIGVPGGLAAAQTDGAKTGKCSIERTEKGAQPH